MKALKNLAILSLVLSIVFAGIFPNKSHAIIGIPLAATGAAPVAGIVLILLGATQMVTTSIIPQAITFSIGAILLDKDNPQDSGFRKLGPADLSRLGITEGDAIDFNSEREKLKALGQTIQAKLIEETESNPELSKQEQMETGKEILNNNSNLFKPGTLRVLDEIARSLKTEPSF